MQVTQSLPQITQINNFPIWTIVKLFFIFGLAVYSVFALVVYRQIQIMSETVKLNFDVQIKLLGLIHLLFALGLLAFAILFL